MAQGPLYQQGYKPQFSGHETFPLRYGWLKKAYDAVDEASSQSKNKNIFLDDNAIARFGVGKNMVHSIRHWAEVAGIIQDKSASAIQTTELGNKLFGKRGFDPYMENPATLWLIHWHLAGIRTRKTTWFWAFSHFSSANFRREDIIKGIERLAGERSWPKIASATLKNDVLCFVRTYVMQRQAKVPAWHDVLESPLTELGLMKSIVHDSFHFVRGSKSTLGDGVFTYALLDFWHSTSSANTLSFEAIAHEPGSPGRVFLLDENCLASYLDRIEEITEGALRCSETSGLKQIVVGSPKKIKAPLLYIDDDFKRRSKRRAA